MYYMAGITPYEFEPHFAWQTLRNWCWAACIKMVLSFHGVDVEQAEVVSRVYQFPEDWTAREEEILAALSGHAIDRRGQPVLIEASTVVRDDSAVISDLERGEPLLVGLSRSGESGHLYVLREVEYVADRRGCHCVTAFLTDPDDDRELILNWDQFREHLGFIARIRVTRLVD